GLDPDARQVSRVFAPPDRVDHRRVSRPEPHRVPGPAHLHGKGGAPRPSAQHADPQAHALAPRRPPPTTGADTSSSGHLERGTKRNASSPALPARPARMRSMPAQAIMAALSVHS